MRKSNIIVIAILVLLSIEFLWLWNYLKFSLTDPVDLIITVVWWLVIIAVVVAIVVVERRRRERIRSVFVSDGVLYNCETGIIRLGEARDAKDYVRRFATRSIASIMVPRQSSTRISRVCASSTSCARRSLPMADAPGRASSSTCETRRRTSRSRVCRSSRKSSMPAPCNPGPNSKASNTPPWLTPRAR